MAGMGGQVGVGLTAREAEVLRAVAERLGNQAIAERLHVSKRTVESHIAALRRKLGVTGRADLAELGVDLRRTSGPATLPTAPLTSLVGRDREAGELAALLDEHRLVTLTGPGGVGKTRLAHHVARICAEPDAARLADLAPVDHDLVGDTLARALGVVPRPGYAVRDELREVAGGLDCLLLVDNCEHVIGEAAELVAELLAAGRQLRVLATSREPLGVPGEVSYEVPTLAEPDAVRLFVERAAAVGTSSPSFTLTEDNTPAVAALVRRLDGLPLAIELAASRVRSFGPAELLAHLDRRFELLSHGGRAVPPRHRTLRNAIDWSYQLLEADERALFDRLGVFPAEFDFPAAQAIAGDTVISLLPRLVDKSLVSALGHGSHRYRLLETIRVYAAERLDRSGGTPAAKVRHAAYYLGFAERAAEHLRGRGQRAAFDRLTAEQPNLRAAMAFSVAAGDREAMWRWIAALERFWDATGHRREAYDWIQRAFAIGDPPATAAAVNGLAAAGMLLRPADTRVGFGLAHRAWDRAAELDDLTRARAARAVGTTAIWIRPELVQPALHDSLSRIGPDEPWERAATLQALAITSGSLTDALRWGQESVGLFRRVGDRSYAANALFVMAQRSIYAGVADDVVEQWLAESQALAEAVGSEDDRAHAIVGFAQLVWLRGEHEHAAELMGQCLPTLRRLGDERCTGRALHILGVRAAQRGQLAEAEELLRASIRAIARAGQARVLIDSLEALAGVVSVRDRPREAASLLGAADRARENAATHLWPLPPSDDRLRQRLVKALGPAAFDEAYGERPRLAE
jgi:predicted ATPase/DNA-binding CsgD family transcriptional regulator